MLGSRRLRASLVVLTYALIVTALLAACARDAAPRNARTDWQSRSLTVETPDPVRGASDPEALEHALLEVGRDASVQLKGDGRLAELAERMASRAGDRDLGALIAQARSLDLADAALLVRRVSARAADLLPAALRVELPAAVRVIGATHFGLYVPPKGDSALVVLSRRPLVLEPVPRAIADGGSLHLRGRLAADVRGAKMVWRDPLGQRRAFALDGNLVVDVRLSALAAGTHDLLLSEQTADGERSLLAFTVEVGDPGAAPEAVEVEDAALAEVRRQLIARLGTLRAEHGLAAFASDTGLGRLASARCPAPAGEPPQGDQEFEATSANGADVDALYAALIADPVVRARLFAPEPPRLGLAVCAEHSGLRALALLAAPLRASDDESERAAGRVLLAINAHRRTRGAPPLRPDAELTAVAQRAAAALLAQPAEDRDAVMQRANGELERFALSFRRVAAVTVVVRDLLDAATLEPALDAGASVVGIATAEQVDAGTIAVIFALGWDR
ncbi:MAG TPA: hypothetical protein VK509_11130 [Polyangiales bacterium]|nr:hypothetical protein [Polyangiales bacterium]